MSWALAAGDVLAHYRVVSPLGSGGTAQVYLAEDMRLGRRRALKILSPRGARDDERLQRSRTIDSLAVLPLANQSDDPEFEYFSDGLTEILINNLSQIQWLTEACAQRAPFLGYVDVEPATAPLLQDPACRGLLRQHGFRA
jgi:serine/threonine protein kinase